MQIFGFRWPKNDPPRSLVDIMTEVIEICIQTIYSIFFVKIFKSNQKPGFSGALVNQKRYPKLKLHSNGCYSYEILFLQLTVNSKTNYPVFHNSANCASILKVSSMIKTIEIK